MMIFEITALLMVLTALFSFINYRALRMPTTMGVIFIALAISLGIVALGWIGVDIGQSSVSRILNAVDFNQALLHGMLSFLLFAGACGSSLKTWPAGNGRSLSSPPQASLPQPSSWAA